VDHGNHKLETRNVEYSTVVRLTRQDSHEHLQYCASQCCARVFARVCVFHLLATAAAKRSLSGHVFLSLSLSLSNNVMRQPVRRSMLANEENKRRLGEDRAKDDDLG